MNNQIAKSVKRCNLVIVGLTLLAATMNVLSQQQTLVYANDFETAAGSEWSRRNISTTPIGNRSFLGEFGSESVSLVITQLPPHNMIAVGFDLYVIRSWDGSGP